MLFCPLITKKALANAGAFWFIRFSPVGGEYCRVRCIAAAARDSGISRGYPSCEPVSGDWKSVGYCVWKSDGQCTRKLVVHRARTPDGQHMRTFAGGGGCILGCRRAGLHDFISLL